MSLSGSLGPAACFACAGAERPAVTAGTSGDGRRCRNQLLPAPTTLSLPLLGWQAQVFCASSCCPHSCSGRIQFLLHGWEAWDYFCHFILRYWNDCKHPRSCLASILHKRYWQIGKHSGKSCKKDLESGKYALKQEPEVIQSIQFHKEKVQNGSITVHKHLH